MINNRVGIMGGSFDPIHLGHLVVANEVLNIFHLDKIIFVPTGNPPHKTGLNASSWDRYIMTNLATMSNPKFTVSDIEVKKTSKSYSLDTLKVLHNIYPNSEFYFITGADAVIDLPNWYRPEELLKLCKFIAVTRPGFMESVEAKVDEIRKNLKGDIELLQIPMLQISSTDIRQRFKTGLSAKYLLPEAVEQYIIKNQLYGCNIDINELKNKLKENNPKIYEHSLSTMEEAVRLALHYGVDVKKAKIAGLLHDCGKMSKGDNLTHSKTGAKIAKEIYNIHDEDILDAIKYHTTGRENMTMIEKVIFIADKIEPRRNYDGIDELRKIAYTNINDAIIRSLESTIEYVKERNLELDKESLITLQFLRRQNEQGL